MKHNREILQQEGGPSPLEMRYRNFEVRPVESLVLCIRRPAPSSAPQLPKRKCRHNVSTSTGAAVRNRLCGKIFYVCFHKKIDLMIISNPGSSKKAPGDNVKHSPTDRSGVPLKRAFISAMKAFISCSRFLFLYRVRVCHVLPFPHQEAMRIVYPTVHVAQITLLLPALVLLKCPA